MKKIAILLTGQLRTWKLCCNLVDVLRKKYDADIFLSIDRNNLLQHEHMNYHSYEETSEVNDAISYYKPINYFISHNYDETDFIKNINNQKIVYIPTKDIKINVSFNINKELIFEQLYSTDFCKKDIINEDTKKYKILGEQYYMVYKAYEMLEKYISDTNINYDIIIRLRFDQFIYNDTSSITEYNLDMKDNNIIYNTSNIEKCKNAYIDISLDNGENNTIHIFGGGYYKHYAYLNDQFWYHKPDLIERMKLFYIELPNVINKCSKLFFPWHGCWIEHFFCNYIVDNNIKIKKSCLNGLFIRSNS